MTTTEDTPPVGCICTAGKVCIGLRIVACQHCGGSGSIPREKYAAIVAERERDAERVAA